jgi:hypothetical protein
MERGYVVSIPEWLREELARRAANPTGWDSVDTGADNDRSRSPEPLRVPAAEPWTKAKRWE